VKAVSVEMYVLFDRPSDFPSGYVLRRFTAGRVVGVGADVGVMSADEEPAYRAVLVQALVTVLDICQRAKAMQSSIDAARGSAATKQPAAAAAGAFPRWFPSERAPAYLDPLTITTAWGLV